MDHRSFSKEGIRRREGASMAAVVISHYDPSWPSLFASLASSVAAALGPVLVRVEHVGGTAVPSLPAKPIIDLDVVVQPADVAEAIRRLSGLGYTHLGDLGVTGREAFVYAVAFSKDGRWIATGGASAKGGVYEVILWDAKTGEVKQTFAGLTEWVHVVAFSPDGKTLAVCGGASRSSDEGKGSIKTSGELTLFRLE
jgi:GrpB-like predicted nucleotidyltransferase (UPF0157 family)